MIMAYSKLTPAIVVVTIILQQLLPCHTYSAFDSVQKIAPRNASKEAEVACVIVSNNAEIRKQVGAFWVAPEDPCLTNHCVFDDKSRETKITVSRKECGQLYCDVDSEPRLLNDKCCKECVKTKCVYKNNYLAIGETWPDTEECVVLRCVQPAEGEVELNILEKICDPVPSDCPKAYIYTKDCCQYCRTDRPPIAKLAGEMDARVSFIEGEDTWNEEYYKNHPCNRECKEGEEPMTCEYRFVIEWYQTMSKACYDCPRNNTDCTRTHCIPADGVSRSVTVANRMMPGPSIEVCENDYLVIDVHNDLLGETTTLHWHGMHQKDYPYMDGVPHITQCPISPHSSFRYAFQAQQTGTHFWHSHTGMQRGDGLFGAMIVRRPRAVDPHANLYDFDLSEHRILVQDWLHEPGVVIFTDHHHSRGDNKPYNILVNGHGRFYPGIWEEGKEEAKMAKEMLAASFVTDKPTTNAPNSTMPNTTEAPRKPDEEVALTSSINITSVASKVYNEFTRLTEFLHGGMEEKSESSLAADDKNETPTPLPDETEMPTTEENEAYTETNIKIQQMEDHVQKFVENVSEIKNREKRAVINTSLEIVPHQIYNVEKGFRYRFRIINGEYLNCPIAISIDDHVLTVISSDGNDLIPVDAGSIVTYSGERWDFVLHANQTVGNYWVRFKGLMDCSDKFTSAFQVAILRYAGAPDIEPEGTLGWYHNGTGLEVNTMNIGSGHEDKMTVAELKALPHYNTVAGVDTNILKPEADFKFFIYYDFYPKDNPIFHPSEYYSFNDSLGKTNKVLTPQLNHISLEFPASTLLSQRDEIDDSLFCNETTLAAQGTDCRKEFCYCHHVLQVPLNAVVELIFVDEGVAYDANHPFHLHGNSFRVLAVERIGSNVTIDAIKQMDKDGLLKRNFVNSPVKDSVTVPDGGYTIVRFQAYNPGYWLLHCHLEFHAEIGMAVVIKVGDNSEMAPVPKNFPTCGDYMPDIRTALSNNTSNSASSGVHTQYLLYTIYASTLIGWLLYNKI